MDIMDPAPRKPLTPAQRWILWLLGGGFVGLIAADLAEGFSTVKLSIGFIVLCWVPTLILHEVGHALAAKLMGWRVYEVVIGYGRLLFRLSIGETLVTLRAIPLAGHVVPSPRSQEVARIKSALIFLSGPVIELFLVILIGMYIRWDRLLTPTNDTVLVAVQSLALTAFIGAVINLIPFQIHGSASDGMGAILSFFVEPEHFKMSAAVFYLQEAENGLDMGNPQKALSSVQSGLKNFPGNLSLEIMQAVCFAAQGEEQKAHKLLQKIRDLPELSPTLEAEALFAATRVVLESNDHGLLTEAESACQAAIELSSLPQYLIALGRIQIEQGRFKLAIETLMHAYKSTRDARLEDLCLAYLAIAAHGDGRIDDRQLYFDELRYRKPSAFLLKRVRIALQNSPKSSSL